MSSPTAKAIAHSKSVITGKEVITFELEFPRIVLAEFNTHSALSKNSSSSRAIPVAKILEQVRNNPAMPVRFGAANKGMQDAGEHAGIVTFTDEFGPWSGSAEDAWHYAAMDAAQWAERFYEAGYAKQICNRLIEPFQTMKVVMTATELNNFIWLRDHPAADPTIEALAKAIKESKETSVPVELQPGEWHTPYYGNGSWKEGFDYDYQGVSLQEALAISASCCAQASFRTLDDSLEKAYSVVDKLNLKGENDEPVHASPTEHQCTPIAESEPELKFQTFDPSFDAFVPKMIVGKVNVKSKPETWEEGITHMDRDGTMCSGNLKGFIQYRQLIPNNVKKG